MFNLTPEHPIRVITQTIAGNPRTCPEAPSRSPGPARSVPAAGADVVRQQLPGQSPVETADAVVVVDRIDRVVDAVHAGRRSVFIARQSVLCGMGLSLVAMGVAAAGYLPPVAGALLQEGIDLAVILNALRALRG